jgi:hypothetical protein
MAEEQRLAEFQSVGIYLSVDNIFIESTRLTHASGS